ncbi:MAG: outer membrane beta-barrel protein [Bdellovibrionales bacterium]
MHSKILIFLAALFSATAYAEDLGGFKITGSLDFDYVYNFNVPQPVAAPTGSNLAQPPGNNRYRAFDLYHDDFNLALAEVIIQKAKGDVGVFLALDLGHTAEVLSPNDEVSKHISQAYITYAPKSNPAFSVNAGKMLTHLGYELIKTRENWQYSRSLLFAYALPYWHTGLAAHYSLLDERLVPSIYIYNETSGVYENSRSKTVGAQLKVLPNKDSQVIYNYLSGVELTADGVTHVRTLHELIATYQLLPNLAFAADAVFGHLTRAKYDQSNGEWFAWTAALKWSRGWFYLSPRYENYWDRSGASIETGSATVAPVPQRIESTTLTAGFLMGDGLETRLEYRQDRSTADSFLTKSTARTPTQTTLTAGILYDF